MTQAKQADAGRPATASASTRGAIAGEPEQFRQRADAPGQALDSGAGGEIEAPVQIGALTERVVGL